MGDSFRYFDHWQKRNKNLLIKIPFSEGTPYLSISLAVTLFFCLAALDRNMCDIFHGIYIH